MASEVRGATAVSGARTTSGATHTGPGASARATTVGALCAEVAGALDATGVLHPKVEARDMVAAVMDAPRLWPTVNAEAPVPADLAMAARAAAARRAAGTPFAYAVGRAAFRHLTLDVDERVLIPRQETELLPEIVLEMVGRAGGIAVDVGTGSGAIALSLASEGAFDSVVATDVSLDALAVARANAGLLAAALRAPVSFLHGSGLAPVASVAPAASLRAVVANPPYISFAEMASLPASVRDWEPTVALCCADDGLDVTVGIVRDAAFLLEPGGALALEVDVRRAGAVAERLAADGRYHDISVRLDLTGRERFVTARRLPPGSFGG